MNKRSFGMTTDGKSSNLFLLKTKQMELSVSDYGSSLVNLMITDKSGKQIDVVLGYDNVKGYESDDGYYLGCNVGRNANRISNAEFMLNNIKYVLDKNNGENNLHSGFAPYSKRIWEVEKYSDTAITFSLESPHMDQGFPGNLKMYVTYEIISDSSFRIVYEATPDMDTILNVTNHSYFNLNGEGSGDIHNHNLIVYAEHFTASDEAYIPTGEILSVAHTPMDFRNGKKIGEQIGENYIQLINAEGYDHNWITDTSGKLHDIVILQGDVSGIVMKIATDYPGVQVYTGNFLDGVQGKNGHIYEKRDGVCFEPQFYPDAINRPEFISPVCKAGEKFRREIVYSFEIV